MPITPAPLPTVDRGALMALMNDPRVRRQLPLALGAFDEQACEAFLSAKQRMWVEQGYGPTAFLLDGRFVGWGGLQPDGGEPDLGLVLHPDHWGRGPALCRRIIRDGFEQHGFTAIYALLPPTRPHTRGLARLGFEACGQRVVDGVTFLRFRLLRQRWVQ